MNLQIFFFLIFMYEGIDLNDVEMFYEFDPVIS